MIRMHWKIQLILLLISLFFVGLGMESIVDEKKIRISFAQTIVSHDPFYDQQCDFYQKYLLPT